MRNIVLTGFMGTGKSSVGTLLAEKLGLGYCDLDALIVDKAGMSINRIFEKFGEQYFRDIETEVLSNVSSGERLVISTGGGAVISKRNREILNSSGYIVNLTASEKEIYSRLHTDDERPLLKDNMSIENIRKMLNERERFYAEADIRIDTNGKKVEDIVLEILTFLEGKKEI